MKICKVCKIGFPATSEFFYTDRRTRTGLRPKCKSCQLHYNKTVRNSDKSREALREWRKNNPDKVKVQQKLANSKKSMSGYHKKYYSENKDRINKKRNEWLKRTGKGLEYIHKRRDSMSGTVDLKSWNFVISIYGNKCLYPTCDRTDIERDHVVPLSKNGRNCVCNLQPLCTHHNRSKWSKIIDYRDVVYESILSRCTCKDTE